MKRILVVHTAGGVGDVLLSTCVVHALKEAHPGADVDFLCARSTSPALLHNPEIREVMLLDRKAPKFPQPFLEWVKRLKERRYDAALVLWSSSGLAWLLWCAGIPIRVGQDSRLMYSFLYTHKVRVRSEHGDVTSHWTDILLDYVRSLGIQPGPAQVSLHVGPAERLRAAELLGDAPGPTFGFHSSKGLRVGPERWPTDVFAGLASSLQREFGARMVLTGSPAEAELVAPVAAGLDPERTLNLCGQTDLATLAAVAERCDVFLCPDSGPMHVAAAVGTPVVGIYALEEDFPMRWAPYSERSRIIRPAARNCRPGCRKADCPDFRCYRQVDPQAVAQAVRSLLAR